MKVPGGIQTNFMPMLFVKFLGGSFLSWAWRGKACEGCSKNEAEEASHGNVLLEISG